MQHKQNVGGRSDAHAALRSWAGTVLVVCIVLAWSASAAGQGAAADDQRCLNCHGQSHIQELGPEQRRQMVATEGDRDQPPPAVRPELFVPATALSEGVHADAACVSCHADAAILPHAASLERISCNDDCHAPAAEAYRRGRHAEAALGDDAQGPDCVTCHGGHDIRPPDHPEAPTRTLNVASLCGDCHESHTGSTTNGADASTHVHAYLDSVHGRAVAEAGLNVAATCVDCHSAHEVLPADDPDALVHRDRVPETCGQCHEGITETYAGSIHGQRLAEDDPRAPVCTDCHTAHRITRADTPDFMLDLVEECGSCHDGAMDEDNRSTSLYETYRRSYHGQVTALGGTRVARCSDCHGAHDILPIENPESRLHEDNRVRTCAKCHEGANANFAMFQPHADFRDREQYPLLHAVWLYFIVVMSLTFGLFGLHTAVWFARETVQRRHYHDNPHAAAHGRAIQRFRRIDRINHALLIVSFFGLTLTGMPLLFSDQYWAQLLARMLGGVDAAGTWHRLFAIMLMINFVVHLVGVVHRIRERSIRDVLFGGNSLLPRWQDLKDLRLMLRWFLRGGPRPGLDHWTYWEKFDYWAEIVGTLIIGGSGLLLWFPEFFSRWIPGWIFNIATVIHGYEALLAVGFIFTIHFFNAHLRWEKFPVDDVIFTGRVPEAEFAHEREQEYQRLREAGDVDQLVVEPAARWQRWLAVAVGVVAMLIGTTMVALIILAGFGVL